MRVANTVSGMILALVCVAKIKFKPLRNVIHSSTLVHLVLQSMMIEGNCSACFNRCGKQWFCFQNKNIYALGWLSRCCGWIKNTTGKHCIICTYSCPSLSRIFDQRGQIPTARKSNQVVITPVSRNLRKPDKKSPPEVSALMRENCICLFIVLKLHSLSEAGSFRGSTGTTVVPL